MAGPRDDEPRVTPFDLERVRKNWERALEAPDTELTERLLRVRPPSDAFASARTDLARVRKLTSAELAEHAVALAPFLDRVDALVARMEKAGESPGTDDDPAALREELRLALADLEDLLEVFAFVQR